MTQTQHERLSKTEAHAQRILINLMVTLESVLSDELKPRRIYGQLGHLVREVGGKLDRTLPVKAQIDQLLHIFYRDLGFACDPMRYYLSDNLKISTILDSKRGMPVSLGAILLFLANRFALPLLPVNFPTQLILKAQVGREVAFIDPWNGDYISLDHLNKLIQGHLGFGATLNPRDVALADTEILEGRLVQLTKMALMREEQDMAALRLIEWCMQRYPENPYELLDRGVVLANLGCVALARDDFNNFIKKCPEDPNSQVLRDKITQLENISHIYH
ncbi:tetratricopeptide repeat protein [Pasteurellaceae bacterium HPA106]|uniref:SirB1 family protein n=1 Tax=Spirabiliibacterium pneumoniae TaxID=221400 RepID=UPI001AAD9325|nr:tetratricopeptide repeat protein [Spirabiliibacterium pneumoniae]MBE2895430.1 tetratricopeptide repeat protein [Spirabiliibacterium pneumoniae]